MTEMQRLVQEHLELRALVAELRERCSAGGPTDAAALHAQVERLARALFAHFEFEEQGGLFADVLAQRPELDGSVARLLQQHQDLRDGLSAVVGQLDRARLLQILDSLERHEQEETELLHEGLLTDLGAGY